MKTFSIMRLAELTGRHRKTVEKILAGVAPDERVRGQAGLINRYRMVTFVDSLERYAAASKTDHPLTAGRAELVRENCLSLKMRNDTLAAQFVRRADVLREFGNLVTVTRERLLGLPGAVAHELGMRTAAEIETVLEDRMHDALSELSQPDADRVKHRGV